MLLSRANVDQAALLSYAREAADFSTNHQLPKMDFAINHYGQPDVAMFDFTCMYASENAALVRKRNGHQLLVALVGDSLLEVREKDMTLNNGTKNVPLFKEPTLQSYVLLHCIILMLKQIRKSVFCAALLANGDRHRARLLGSHGLGMDGEKLGTGRVTPRGVSGEVRQSFHCIKTCLAQNTRNFAPLGLSHCP